MKGQTHNNLINPVFQNSNYRHLIIAFFNKPSLLEKLCLLLENRAFVVKLVANDSANEERQVATMTIGYCY